MYGIKAEKFHQYQIPKLVRVLGVAALMTLLFVYAALLGYSPIIGGAIAAPIVYFVFYARNEFLFARIFIFTLGFAAFLNLPVTSGGFPISTVIMMTGFLVWCAAALIKKDPEFARIFIRRPEQLLVSGFIVVMFISIKDSMYIAMAVKQIQLFIYCWLVFFYLQMMLRDRRRLETAISWVLAGGLVVGLIGFFELIIDMSPYVFLGNRSLFMADVSEVVLNVHAGRINGLIGDSPYHGIYMVIIASLAVYKFFTVPSKSWKFFSFIVFGVASANVLLTASRGALLAEARAFMVIWTYLEIRNKWLIFIGLALILKTIVGV